jgi:tetratricopeptide (TPR) repeat protein
LHFNIGAVHLVLGQAEQAVASFSKAVKADNYLAIAYFQRGAAQFMLENYTAAVADFTECFEVSLFISTVTCMVSYVRSSLTLFFPCFFPVPKTSQAMRSNLVIDYKQLGLDYRLSSCEIMFNRGVCKLRLGEEGPAFEDMLAARAMKGKPEHAIVDEVCKSPSRAVSIFIMPMELVFRPLSEKVKNATKVNYLGKSQIVAADHTANDIIGFSAAKIRKVRIPFQAFPFFLRFAFFCFFFLSPFVIDMG